MQYGKLLGLKNLIYIFKKLCNFGIVYFPDILQVLIQQKRLLLHIENVDNCANWNHPSLSIHMATLELLCGP